jgi:hypothetical protein
MYPASHVSVQLSPYSKVFPSAHAASSAPFAGALRPDTVQQSLQNVHVIDPRSNLRPWPCSTHDGWTPLRMYPASHVSVHLAPSAKAAPGAHAASSAPFAGALRPDTVQAI